jgi:hypothetical protein
MLEIGLLCAALAFVFVFAPWAGRMLKMVGHGASLWTLFGPIAVLTFAVVGYLLIFTAASATSSVQLVVPDTPVAAAVHAVAADAAVEIRTNIKILDDQANKLQRDKLNDRRALKQHTDEVFNDINDARCKAGLCN